MHFMSQSQFQLVRSYVHVAVQLMLEEFGKWVKEGPAAPQEQRDAFYSLVYDALQTVSSITALFMMPCKQ